MSPEFVLIGDPVSHSLSPAMHNALYKELAKTRWPFSLWEYNAVQCPDEESALHQIGLVRTGRYRGMNVTMPYKRLAFENADYSDAASIAAGGSNVLVRDEHMRLRAYNTDGKGAIGAIERMAAMVVEGRSIVVCGTGPTASAIAVSAAVRDAADVAVLSRDESRALSCINRMRSVLDARQAACLRGIRYDSSADAVRRADVVIDATPVGMDPQDDAVVDTALLHEGQVVMDTVYAHGQTALLKGAREQGAFAMDGLEMLVEQAALSVEIWADALALPLIVDRDVMRQAALHRQTKNG